ncbi:acyl carrier protein [Candidatus Liberibacter sp.]|uniref:acyl carrier protein n=1 Tax=Candidatus Liberibacter sp. TaxID=34022 RepID=UPI0015F4BC28|nr:acyl carrier protein [Candidatus Liberibacter sp.]MBA5724206.1 acyl carrier protein [Candidatus Liberibacter sp.]
MSHIERVKKIVVEHLHIEPEIAKEINENSRFIENLGADSLDTVELVLAFEEAFEIEISDDVASGIVTIGDVVKLIPKSA